MKNLFTLFLFILLISSCCNKECCTGDQTDSTELISEKYFEGTIDLLATKENPIGLVKIDFGKDEIKYAVYDSTKVVKIEGMNNPKVFVKVELKNNIPLVTELVFENIDEKEVDMTFALAQKFKLDYHGFSFKTHPTYDNVHSQIHRIKSSSYNQNYNSTQIIATILNPETGSSEDKSFILIGTLAENGIGAIPFETTLYIEYINPSDETDDIPTIRVSTTHFHTKTN